MNNDTRFYNYPLSYALKLEEIYYGFPRKYIHGLPDKINKSIDGDYKIICARVLRYFFYLVIKDIIENKTIFKFPPLQKGAAYLQMDATSGEDFIKARKKGAFQDVDFLASNFTGYNLVLRFNNRYGHWKKRLYVSSKYRDLIIEKTNRGEGW